MDVKCEVLLQLFNNSKKWDQNVSRAKIFLSFIVKSKKLGLSAKCPFKNQETRSPCKRYDLL